MAGSFKDFVKNADKKKADKTKAANKAKKTLNTIEEVTPVVDPKVVKRKAAEEKERLRMAKIKKDYEAKMAKKNRNQNIKGVLSGKSNMDT